MNAVITKAMALCIWFLFYGSQQSYAELTQDEAMEATGLLMEAAISHDRQELQRLVATYSTALDTAATDFPTNSVVLLGAGITLDQRGRRKEAHDHIEKAWKLNQHSVIAPFFAESLNRNKRPVDAFEVLKKANSDSPGQNVLMQQLAVVAAVVQEYETALPLMIEWEKVCDSESTSESEHRGHGLVLAQLANCYLHLGRHEEAIATLKKAEALLDSVIVTSPLAETYLKSGRTDEAKRTLTRALKQKNDYPAVLYHTGLLLKLEGKPTAQQYFERAFAACEKFEPNIGFVGEQYFLYHLVCEELGRDDLAKTYRKTAAEMGYTHAAPWKAGLDPSQP